MTLNSTRLEGSSSASWRAVVAASIANALEWFDFVIFGFFAATIAKLFFPSSSESSSLLLTFATFGVTFFIRPFGALIIGSYADRHGRKPAFILTIILMIVGTAIIAFTPTHATIGVWASVLLVLARLIQGFSAGAEFGSVTAFLAEQNPQKRGFYSSWQFASQGMTTILATLFGVLLTTNLTGAQIEAWGWRIPFFFGLLIGPVAYYIRRHLDETLEFQSDRRSAAPLTETVRDGKLRVLVSFGVVVLCNVMMYTVLFMPTYASRQLGLVASAGFIGALLTGAIQVLLIPFVGSLSDRWGRIPLGMASAVLALIAIYPMFWWLQASPTLQSLLLVQAILGVLLAGYMGGLAALMAELFPARVRSTGLSISYAFAAAIFGGLAPFISTWLIEVTGSKLAPSFYIILAAVISLAALVTARRLNVK
jgi:MHS family proline/betaine transporter-like MFS transporter